MAVPTLRGIYALTNDGIDKAVTLKSPGAYVLGPIAPNQKLTVKYVGRSDADLPNRLKQWVGKYPAFMYVYAPTAVEAYHQECELYHGYPPLDNDVHPARPSGSSARCPRCGG